MSTPAPPRWIRRISAVLSVTLMAMGLSGPKPVYGQPPAPAKRPPPVCPPLHLSQTLPDEAWQAYADAVELHGQEDVEGAIAKLEHAYSLWPDPRLLLQQAAWEWKDLHRYARTRALLERVLADTSCVVTPALRGEAKVILQDVMRYVSPLWVLVDPEGAQVSVDGEPQGEAPIREGVFVTPGERRIRITKDGYREWSKKVQVPGGAPVVVEAKLERIVQRSTLVVRAGSGDRISIDGRMVGQSSWQGVVASGGHTLLVSAPGKQPYQDEVILAPGQTRRIWSPLRTLPPQPKAPVDPSTWAWLGAGGVLVTVGVAIALGFHLSGESRLDGNIQTFE